MRDARPRRLKTVAGINQRTLPETSPPDREFRYVDIGAVGRGHLAADPEPMTFESAPSRARRLVRPGDTIVSTVRTYLRAVWPVVGPTDDLVVSTGFAVLTPGPELDPRFLAWAVQSDHFIEEVVARSVGVSYPSINALDLGNLSVPVPSLGAQRAIADYLGAETGRIDEVVTARRAQDEGLRLRQRVAIDLEMDRLSARVRMKHILAEPLAYGAAEAAEADEPDWPRYVRTTDIDDDGGLRPETFRSLPPDVAAPFMLRNGDLLLTRSGTVGKSIRWRVEWGSACFAGYLIRVRPNPKRAMSEFVAYYLKSTRYWDEVGLSAIQATIPNVSAERYGEFSLPVPSLREQRAVVERLDRGLAAMERCRATIQRQIDLLLERRQALITAAVTGQLAIPGVAA